MTLRKKANEINEQKYDTDDWERKIVFDGKQFLIRIPTEVSNILKMKKGQIITFTLKYADPSKPIEDSELTIKYEGKNGKKK